MVPTLILAGGLYHPVVETGDPLVPILHAAGLDGTVTSDVEDGLAALASGRFQRLVIACLRWTMVQNEKHAPHRAEWAMSLSPAGRTAIRDYVASGRGLLAVHAAPISFDDWSEWPELLGIGWRWGRSHHPPMGPLTARPTATHHPVTAGLNEFTVADEIYSDLEVAPWMQPLAEARHPDMEQWRPVIFAGEKDGCRRAYCGLGHDAASLANADHSALLTRAASWVAREG